MRQEGNNVDSQKTAIKVMIGGDTGPLNDVLYRDVVADKKV